MERELVELFETAKKEADMVATDDMWSIEEENRCLEALKELKDFPVNYHILVSTQVGKRLRHLAKHPRKKIRSFAADLIEIWKKIIMDESAQKKNGNSVGNTSVKVDPLHVDSSKKIEKTGVNLKVEQASPRPLKLAKTERGPEERKLENGDAVKIENVSSEDTAEIEKTVKREEGCSTAKKPAADAPAKLPSVIKCNDPIRDKTRELLVQALSKVSNEVDENMKKYADACGPVQVAVPVESVMFNKWGCSTGAHKFKYRSILFNIKDAKNPDFRRKVLLGDIKAESIVNLTAEEMASDQRRLENKQIEEKALFDCERDGMPKATTDQFKCNRCGLRKCTYYQLQTRSADEPMTTFVTCVNCNNHWKFC